MEVAIVKAEQIGNVMITKANGDKNIAESQVKAQVVNKVNSAKQEAQQVMRRTDQQSDVMGIEARARYEASQSKT